MRVVRESTVFYSELSDCIYISEYGFKFYIKITRWSRGLVAKVMHDDQWRYETPPDVVLIAPKLDNIKRERLSSFVSDIPEQARKIAARYQYHQLAVLRLLAYPNADELAEGSPVLFWLLAGTTCRHTPLPDQEIRSLLALRRKDILARLGYIGTQSSVRMLNKINLSIFSETAYSSIVKMVTIPSLAKAMRHYKIITDCIILAVSICPSIIGMKFFKNEYTKDNNMDREKTRQICVVYRDTLRLARLVRRKGFSKGVRRFKTKEEITRYHERLIRKVNMAMSPAKIKQYEERYGRYLPEPVFAGNKEIVPIRTIRDLVIEGIAMNHCVATYVEKILKGQCTIYKVLSPERATLEVETIESVPRIAQIRLANNAPPGRETFMAVEKWLHERLEQKDEAQAS